MDKIIKYSEYELNEGIRNKMKPKSKEELIKNFTKAKLKSKREIIFEYSYDFLDGNPEKFNDFVQFEVGITDIWKRMKGKVIIGIINEMDEEELTKMFNLMIKDNDTVNESIRSLMKPISPEGMREKINDIISNPTGTCRSDVVNVIEKLKEKRILPFVNEEEGKKIAQIALSDDNLMNHIATGREGSILWFMNRYGGGNFFINLDNGRISEIDGPGSGQAIKMLKEIF